MYAIVGRRMSSPLFQAGILRAPESAHQSLRIQAFVNRFNGCNYARTLLRDIDHLFSRAYAARFTARKGSVLSGYYFAPASEERYPNLNARA
jgi:hypothetical protein